MSSVIRQETAVFLFSVLHGVLLTVLYDVLRALRRAFRHSLAVLSVEDFLFWLLAGFLTFLLLYRKTDGEVRGYVVAGIFLGFLLYHLTFSPLVVAVFAWLSELLRRILCLPFHLVAAARRKICRFFCEKNKKRIEFTRKRVYNIKTAFTKRGGNKNEGRLKRGKRNGSKGSKKDSKKEKA